MKYLGRFALLFLLAVKAYATVTVTIDVSGITGGNLPGSSIVISLQHCATARVVGTGQIVPQSQTVYPHFGASTITLFDNTQINCSGQIVSYYSFSFIYQGVTTQIGSYNLPPGIYQLANLTPCTGTACYGPAQPTTPVTQIIAGANVTLSPPTGLGAVTISSSAGGLNQLTGDVSAGPGTGSQATTLATVNAGPGACGDATHVCAITTDPKGRTTAQAQVAITVGASTPATSLVLKGNGSTNGVVAATAGTDYVIPSGNVATATLATNSSAVGGVALAGLCQTGGTGCPAGGSGLTGQTVNFLPKATSSTGSTAPSIIEDLGTGIFVHGTGSPSIVVGTNTNIAPSQDPTVDVARNVGSAVSHGFADDSILNGTNPYASYDTRVEINGSGNINHFAGYQSIPTVDTTYTGTLANIINFVGYANINGSTVPTVIEYQANDVIKSGSGNVGTQYGFFASPMTSGATNWGVYVVSNNSFFGGPVTMNAGANVVGNLTVGSCTGCGAGGSGAPSGLIEDWIAQEGHGSTLVNSGYNFANSAAATSITWSTPTGFSSPVPAYNGTTSFAFATNSTATNFDGSTPFSACAWIYPTTIMSNAVNERLLSTLDTATTLIPGWDFNILGSGGANTLELILISNIASNLIAITSAAPVTINAIHHVCFTYDGSKNASGVALYLDGSSITPTISTNTLTGSIASPVPVAIGALHNGAAASSFYQGSMGQTPVFNRLLSASEVSALFARGPHAY